MTYNKRIQLVLALLSILTAFPQEKGWRGIVPLESMRKDVEQVLGSPKESRGVASTFEIKDGRVRVFYSDGFCSKGGTNDWNVPRDTVVILTFQPIKSVMVADLKLDSSKYERFQDPHLEGAIHYFNQIDGIRISARKMDDGEEIQDITYGPAAKDRHLRCLQKPKAQ